MVQSFKKFIDNSRDSKVAQKIAKISNRKTVKNNSEKFIFVRFYLPHKRDRI